jgi:ketosteroid isomerase-like protein
MKRKTALASLLVVIAICASGASAQQHPRKTAEAKLLYDEIARLDTAMFEAFNAHQLEKVASYFDPGLEFYHDAGGLMTLGDSLAGIKGMFDQNNGMRRDLVPGTLEVYPIKGYGAIEIGEHRFCHKEDGKDDCGTFKFLHIWQKQESGWKITRVVSYDH